MSEFHFLRPEWFIALFPILVAFLIQKRSVALSGQWKSIVAPALQPYMLKHNKADKNLSLVKYVFLLAAILAVVALAGPSWKKQPSQVFNSQAGLVIALDLSLSMSAQDVSPSRLQRAKFKILDVLDQNIGNNMALIAYAGDAHVASPLTRDIKTIQSMLPVLDPYIMPAQGSNVRSLVDESIKLFEQGKSSPKTLLLVTDGVEESDINYAANALKVADIHLSILAVGTKQGAPLVKPDGQFFKDSNGQVIMPGLEWNDLKSLSDKSDGRIRMLTSNDSDIKYLTETQSLEQGFEETEESIVFDQWFDSGYWLVLPIILLALFGFRKGVLLAMCLMIFQPNNSWAQDLQSSSLPDFLLNDNQAAMKEFDDNP
ncbi:MAG: Ca-activated chloride channel family protein, partial [Crocinitomicaceae bacterium]